jgi:DNA polymerase-3 subunit delta'
MHSFLLVGENDKKLEAKIDDITNHLRSKRLSFTLEKISETRSLISFARLSLNKPTTLVIKNIDKASHAALNAFLKILEEPQINLSFVLTCSSVQKLLPTIVSRCQVIKVDSEKEIGEKALKRAKAFGEMGESEKLFFINSIRSRDDALNFTKSVILSSHQALKNSKNLANYAKIIKQANSTYEKLQKNGNVGLQLANFVLQA